jgi:hypothetical protein
MRIMIQFFWFMSRLATAYEPGEMVVYGLRAGPLEGRMLVTQNPRIFLRRMGDPICRESKFQHGRSLPAEEIRSGWETECSQCMKKFYELFLSQDIPVTTMLNWVEKFKSREF